MPLAHRRICGLCGHAFALVIPPGESTERDKLCPRLRDAQGLTRRGEVRPTEPR